MQRPDLERSSSWPSIIHIHTSSTSDFDKDAEPRSAGPVPTKHEFDSFKEDLDNNPQNHFLSPIEMYEYEQWSSDDDSDSDAGDIEWNAGITDFALFDEDRRKAKEGGQVSKKWEEVLVWQTEALKRSIERTRKDSCSEPVKKSTNEHDVPGLTPDTSPELYDDLDVESFHGQTIPRPLIPDFLVLPSAPPKTNEGAAVEKDGALLRVTRTDAQQKPRAEGDRKLQRPGMKYSRTMSGHVHSWKRPSRDIRTVGEDVKAEEEAERSNGCGDAEDGRGRR